MRGSRMTECPSYPQSSILIRVYISGCLFQPLPILVPKYIPAALLYDGAEGEQKGKAKGTKQKNQLAYREA